MGENNEQENDAKGKGSEILQAGKEKLKAGSEAAKKQIHLLPFRDLMEKKVPTATRDKYPILNKLIPLTNFIFTGLVIFILILVIAIATGGGGNPKVLAKQSFELAMQSSSSSNSQKLKAIEKKVGKLSAKNKAIYEQELTRLAMSMFGSMFNFNF
jgi:hypothetical protein